MANSADQIVIGASGTAYFAPLATPLPTTEIAALNGAFVEAGWLGDAGATFTNSRTLTDTMAWQALYPVRSTVTGITTTLSFVMKQVNAANLVLALGGGAVTGGGATAEVQAANLVGFAGTDSYKITYGGSESALITNGTNHTAAGIKAAIEGISGFTGTVTVSDVTLTGFLVTFDATGVRTMFTVTTPTGCTGTFGQLVAGAAAAGSHYTYTPPSVGAVDYRALVLDWADSTKLYRLVIKRGLVTGSPAFTVARGANADLPVEFSVMPATDTDVPFNIYTGDSSFA